jgi:orotate phosphoribosyltransferase
MTAPGTARLARRAVALGLLRLAPEGQPFPGRRGGLPMPALIDVRAIAANLPLRALVIGALLDALSEYPSDAVIGGLSRGGLVLGGQLAVVAGRPFVAVLPEGARASGLQRAVEGDVNNRDVVLFDNVVTTGASLRAAAAHVVDAGGIVAGALVVGTYGRLPRLPFKVHTLLTLNDLLRAAPVKNARARTRHTPSTTSRTINRNRNERKPK